MRLFLLISCSVAALGSAASAAAQCATVDPVIVPQVRLDPLDASGPGELVQPFVLTFRRASVGSEPLVIRYQLVDEDSNIQSRVGATAGPTIEWRGEDSSRDIGAFRGEAYALLRTGVTGMAGDEFATQQSVAVRLTNLRSDLAAGVYREQFTVRYWCGDAEATLPYEAQGAVAVTAVVPSVLSANVAGASVRGEIDFLDFALRQRNLQVSVRSTGPYQVTARSENAGRMVRENGDAGDPLDRIGYTAAFAGKSLDVDGGVAVAMPRSGLLGQQFPLAIAVESVDAKRAGVYADTLTLTLAPSN